MRAVVALLVGVAACADPVIDMSLKLPADDAHGAAFDMSCVTAVEVLAHGKNWPGDPADTKRACISLAGATSLAGVQAAIHDKFELPIPDTGLGAIELNGRTGTCDIPPAGQSSGDLLFYAGNPYLGADSVVLSVKANLSCTVSPIKLRMYDVMKLIASSRTTLDCAGSMVDPDPALDPGAGFGTFTPTLDGLAWNQGFYGGAYLDHSVSASGLATVGPEACLAFNAGNVTTYTQACASYTPPVCATTGDGELEVPVMNGELSYAAIDPVKVGKWGGMIIGSAWTSSPTRHPVSGATVKVDPAHGEVVYLELNTAGKLAVTGTATGPSGLFAVYADTIVDVTITAGTAKRTVKLGAKTDNDFYPPAIALVLVN